MFINTSDVLGIMESGEEDKEEEGTHQLLPHLPFPNPADPRPHLMGKKLHNTV